MKLRELEPMQTATVRCLPEDAALRGFGFSTGCEVQMLYHGVFRTVCAVWIGGRTIALGAELADSIGVEPKKGTAFAVPAVQLPE